MKFWERIKNHITISAAIAWSVMVIVAGFGWAYAALRHTTTPVVVHFNDIAGITAIGSPDALAVFGFGSLVAVAVNGVLAAAFESRDKVFGKLIAVATAALATLLFIAAAVIITVN